jgi:hypothetical protein
MFRPFAAFPRRKQAVISSSELWVFARIYSFMRFRDGSEMFINCSGDDLAICISGAG